MAQLESNLRGGLAGRGQCRHQVTYRIVDRLLAVDGGRDLRANEVAISTPQSVNDGEQSWKRGRGNLGRHHRAVDLHHTGRANSSRRSSRSISASGPVCRSRPQLLRAYAVPQRTATSSITALSTERRRGELKPSSMSACPSRTWSWTERRERAPSARLISRTR
jgi:hypothetical protein